MTPALFIRAQLHQAFTIAVIRAMQELARDVNRRQQKQQQQHHTLACARVSLVCIYSNVILTILHIQRNKKLFSSTRIGRKWVSLCN